mmetsp:Transcript_39015/g.76740  ORF Transcript_39015/g.76740 Transcript_39015/m.76740 type:complete len:222 (-) Transcript_39015:413-1078(-)
MLPALSFCFIYFGSRCFYASRCAACVRVFFLSTCIVLLYLLLSFCPPKFPFFTLLNLSHLSSPPIIPLSTTLPRALPFLERKRSYSSASCTINKTLTHTQKHACKEIGTQASIKRQSVHDSCSTSSSARLTDCLFVREEVHREDPVCLSVCLSALNGPSSLFCVFVYPALCVCVRTCTNVCPFAVVQAVSHNSFCSLRAASWPAVFHFFSSSLLRFLLSLG